jgi:hypothetical protein
LPIQNPRRRTAPDKRRVCTRNNTELVNSPKLHAPQTQHTAGRPLHTFIDPLSVPSKSVHCFSHTNHTTPACSTKSKKKKIKKVKSAHIGLRRASRLRVHFFEARNSRPTLHRRTNTERLQIHCFVAIAFSPATQEHFLVCKCEPRGHTNSLTGSTDQIV